MKQTERITAMLGKGEQEFSIGQIAKRLELRPQQVRAAITRITSKEPDKFVVRHQGKEAFYRVGKPSRREDLFRGWGGAPALGLAGWK